ncbi:MAG: winged helix-turn-helix transcriptional regulator [Chloroflexi bacterium]|nr:winged helix-turn-helix transcriptional regulator [Chloroflexota bacterium]MBM4450248.1 winged helix-turn-helix transcriptional regulator [Chloroflexota bacterium]
MSNFRNEDAERLAGAFKALSNPHRLSIFMRLASCCAPGEACNTDADMRECVGAVGKNLSLSPSTISHHIKELHRAGLIRLKRRGQTVECWVDPETLDSLSAFFKPPIHA